MLHEIRHQLGKEESNLPHDERGEFLTRVPHLPVDLVGSQGPEQVVVGKGQLVAAMQLGSQQGTGQHTCTGTCLQTTLGTQRVTV